MNTIKTDLANIKSFITGEKLSSMELSAIQGFDMILNKTGKGNDFLGWTTLPSDIPDELLGKIDETAAKMHSKAQIMVVTGIGGSYLGARAVIEALGHNFYELLDQWEHPMVVYAGQNISERYLADLLDILDRKDYAITVISKSGTTTEPAIAFRILKNHLEHKYGVKEARERIVAITDKEKGALKQLADEEHYTTFIVPDDVGGRYSVLTPVGLFPIAVAGFDVRALLKGAADHAGHIKNNPSSPVIAYASARNALYEAGKKIEIMVNYEPQMFYFTEWWKQLYGESEGKDGKGIFPAGAGFTTDLHSMGQYIQDGERHIFETVISIEDEKKELRIPSDEDNLDKLNYIAGKRIHEVNHVAEAGTTLAHVDGKVPNIRISIPRIDEYNLGQLIYFFEMACGVSGYMLGVNPFDQPGVEAYKNNMFALLGKPGFEKETENIRKRIGS